MDASDPNFNDLRTQAQATFGLTDDRTAQIVRIFNMANRQNWRIEFTDGSRMSLAASAVPRPQE